MLTDTGGGRRMTDDRAMKVRAREKVGSGEKEREFYLIFNASGQHVALTIGTGLDAATSHIR